MHDVTIGEASRRSGWSPRMLRYLEQERLIVPSRTAAGYRRYGIRELNQLNALAELRRRFGVELTELTQEQADYLGVPVEGPYKSDHYRY